MVIRCWTMQKEQKLQSNVTKASSKGFTQKHDCNIRVVSVALRTACSYRNGVFGARVPSLVRSECRRAYIWIGGRSRRGPCAGRHVDKTIKTRHLFHVTPLAGGRLLLKKKGLMI
ncbi:hypothetical protein EVAR_44141_1 [Eumeta japonica]|uniref:Uncharacterized protein n=1 Tax=Eumeta variegata TaxID=151549 RepID=A0A4C1XKT7_EUMVA|nr:hypothetical protein EVAR_44141_1 [Eumeta japonica]